MNDQTATIAVLRGAPNSDVQALLRKLVERWRGTARLAGVVGEGHGIPDRECGAGYLRSLATGERFPIFTDRGSPTGCHLDGRGAIDAAEMYRTFNCGIGMVVIVESARADEAVRRLAQLGEQALLIGEVSRGDRGVVIDA